MKWLSGLVIICSLIGTPNPTFANEESNMCVNMCLVGAQLVANEMVHRTTFGITIAKILDYLDSLIGLTELHHMIHKALYTQQIWIIIYTYKKRRMLPPKSLVRIFMLFSEKLLKKCKLLCPTQKTEHI
jgi:hypothetical protein